MDVKQKSRNGAVDLWKFLFSLMILIYHGRAFAASDSEFVLFQGGAIGVEFFFIVSGFLMALSAQKAAARSTMPLGTETVNFLWKKIKSIFPYSVIAFIASLAVRNYIRGSDFKAIVVDGINSVWEFFLVQMSGVGTNDINALTWYISAMLLAMLVLYPLIRKNFNVFTHVVAPIIVLFLMGWFYQEVGSIRGVLAWEGFAYRSIFRAFLDISLGCICFAVCEKIKAIDFTVFGRIVLSIIELAGYVIFFVETNMIRVSKYDFIIIVLAAISITITFSEKNILFGFFDNKFFSFLGKLSLPLYLNQLYIRSFLRSLDSNKSYWEMLIIFIILAFAAAIISMAIVKAYQKVSAKLSGKVKPLFIKTDAIEIPENAQVI